MSGDILDKITRVLVPRINVLSEGEGTQRVSITGRNKVLVFGLSFLLLAIFSSSFFAEFGVHNDYSASQWPFPETIDLFQIGRPLGAVLLNLQFYFIHDVSDFKWGRVCSSLVTIGGFLLTGHLFTRIAPSMGRFAIPTAFMIWSLPPAVVYVLWLTTFVPGTVATIMATLAYFIVDKSYRISRRSYALSVWLSGYLLLYLCFFIYPPSAYFFLVFTSWSVLFSDDRRARRRAPEELIAVAVLSAAYLIAIKLALSPFLHVVFGPTMDPISAGGYQMSPVEDISSRASVAAVYLAQSLTLWFFAFGWETSYAVLLVIIIGAAFRILQKREDLQAIFWEILRWACVLSGLMMSMAPFVLSHDTGPPPLRVLFSAESILVITVFCAIATIFGSRPRVEFVIVALFVTIATLFAGFTVIAVKINDSSEFNFLKKSLEDQPIVKGPILILLPPRHDIILHGWLGKFVYSELLATATNAAPINGIFEMILSKKGLMPGITYFSFIPWASNVIIEANKQADERPLPLPFIDMSLAGFQEAQREEVKRQSNSFYISVSKTDGIGPSVYSVANAFDESGSTFWETSAALPFDLTVRSQKHCLDASTYAFRAYDGAPGRMPRSWQIFASGPDDRKFKVIGQVTDAPLWGNGELRRFSLPSRACIYALRFRFLNLEDSTVLRISKIRLLPN